MSLKPGHDGAMVGASDVPGWWIAAIDLDDGTVTNLFKTTPKPAPQPLPPTILKVVRDGLEKMHAAGDVDVRLSQFVLGEVRFVVTIGGVSVTQVFQGDGCSMDEPMETILAIAHGRFPKS